MKNEIRLKVVLHLTLHLWNSFCLQSTTLESQSSKQSACLQGAYNLNCREVWFDGPCLLISFVWSSSRPGMVSVTEIRTHQSSCLSIQFFILSHFNIHFIRLLNFYSQFINNSNNAFSEVIYFSLSKCLLHSYKALEYSNRSLCFYNYDISHV